MSKIKFSFFIAIFLLFFVFSLNSNAAITVDFTTYDGYKYTSIPDLPSAISNYKYYILCNFYNYDGSTSSNNRLVLLYSNNPFTFNWEGEEYNSRAIIKSANMCDSGSYYYINSNKTSWTTASSGMYGAGTTNAHFYYLDKRQPTIYLSNANVYYTGSSKLFYQSFVEPSITNTEEEIINWNFSNLNIDLGDCTLDNDIEIHFNYCPSDKIIWISDTDYTLGQRIEDKVVLNKYSEYYNSSVDMYLIPKSDILTKQTIRTGDLVYFTIYYTDDSGEKKGPIYSLDYFIGERTSQDIEDEKDEKIFSGIEDLNNTNKGMWESIKTILNFLNPFSEDFFVYKLIELLVEALKSLFVPSDDFFSNWLDDLNSYFGDTFGILYYPFELLVDFLNRIEGIAETDTAIISVPSFELSFMGHKATIFKDMSFDFNTILEEEAFKNIHDIYLLFTDVILWLGLVYLTSKCIRSILGGMGDEIEIRVDESQEGEQSYQRYVRYQENKQRYKKEKRNGR